MTSVSAIIPTTGRVELRRAVLSVIAQTVPVEVVVVLDRLEMLEAVRSTLHDLRHTLVLTNGGEGGGAARNLGVNTATTDYVAFLDDDDEWCPRKIETQLDVLGGRARTAVLSMATLVGSAERVLPERIFGPPTVLEDYLLTRTTIRLRKNFMQSSMLLLPIQLAKEVPWREDLRRHQDWALFVDLKNAGAEFFTVQKPLVRVHQNSDGSVSRSTNWRASIEWLESLGASVSDRPRADFLLAIAVRSAVAAGEYRSAMRLFLRAVRLRPHSAAVVLVALELARKVIQ